MFLACKLCDIEVDDVCEVLDVKSSKDMQRRFLDLGLIEGTVVKCVGKSPAGDPAAYMIRGSVIAIRNKDSKGITVKRLLKGR